MRDYVMLFEEYDAGAARRVWSRDKALGSAGTAEEYEEYVMSIFPDSKIKDIVWHGTERGFDDFDAGKTGSNFSFSKGIHFDFDPGKAGYWGRYVMPAVIDAREVFVVKDHGDLEFARDRYRSGRMLGHHFDTVISDFETETGGRYVSVAEPEQAWLLGTKKDAARFREFVKNKKMS